MMFRCTETEKYGL